MRFHVSRDLRVQERDAYVDAEPGPAVQLSEQGQVTEDQRAFCDQDHRIAELAANLQAVTCDAIRGFHGLIAVGIPREGQQFASPACAGKSLAKQGGGVMLHDEFRFEVGAGAEPPVFVTRSGIAVGTTVKAAAVWVNAPTKIEVGALVTTQDFARVVFEDLHGNGGGPLE